MFSGKSVSFQEGSNHLTITLNHLREFAESVNVAYSPPVIDPQQPDEQKQLNNVEILAVPYPASQDLRSALPLMQGVVEDAAGNLHFNGGATDQTNYTLEGFHISDPYTGTLEARISIESVRSLDLESSRYSAEKGRGSAGSLDIKTAMGDDRWRFSGTNFIPGDHQSRRLHDQQVDAAAPGFGPVVDRPRLVQQRLRHVLRRERNQRPAARSESEPQPHFQRSEPFSGQYYAREHPDGQFPVQLQRREPAWALFSRPDRNDSQQSYESVRIHSEGSALLRWGCAGGVRLPDSRGLVRRSPQGDLLFQILPSGHRGNYFEDDTRHFNRQQWLSNAYLPQFHWAGTHQFKAGVDLQRSAFDRSVNRHAYEVLRNDLSVARRVTFVGKGLQGRENFEVAQYVQDRWVPRDGILIETGLRAEWDEVVRDVLWSPRFSVAYAPKWMGETKLAGGVGVFHDD